MDKTRLDETGHTILEYYTTSRPFSSFLPGIAGPTGIPKALAEAISRTMTADEQTQNALQDLDLNPSVLPYHSAATAAVMALIVLQLEALKFSDK